jgi:hypothetical protein
MYFFFPGVYIFMNVGIILAFGSFIYEWSIYGIPLLNTPITDEKSLQFSNQPLHSLLFHLLSSNPLIKCGNVTSRDGLTIPFPEVVPRRHFFSMT